MEDLESLVKELQYRYQWLLADFNTLFKTTKTPVWTNLYALAKEANGRVLSLTNLNDAHELIGAYWVLQSAMDKELVYTKADKQEREAILQKQFAKKGIIEADF